MSLEYFQNCLEKRGYTFGKQIGKGSSSIVVKAKYKNEEEKLACKIVDRKKGEKRFMEKFFPREIELILKASHPNIIANHSILETRGGLVFIFMECAEKGDLLKFIEVNQVEEKMAKIWCRQLAQAIDYLHNHLGYAHRDLKCENILISESNKLMVSKIMVL